MRGVFVNAIRRRTPTLPARLTPVMTPPFLSLTRSRPRTTPDGNTDGKTPASYRLLNRPLIFPFPEPEPDPDPEPEGIIIGGSEGLMTKTQTYGGVGANCRSRSTDWGDMARCPTGWREPLTHR